ncbi:MAG TPA: hypothetical protein ENN03_07105 [bacterium]|nr:hypothetical protein [bacterium]
MKTTIRVLSAVCMMLTVAGCGFAVRQRPQSLRSNYQNALREYYRAVDTGAYEPVLAILDEALNGHPGDSASRILRAHIQLARFQKTGSDSIRRCLIDDCRFLAAALESSAGEPDWIEPALHVALGNLLLLEGEKAVRPEPVAAYVCFRAAGLYFGLAFSVTRGMKGAGVRREERYAVSGLIQSGRGILEALSFMDPKRESPAVRGVYEETLLELENWIRGGNLKPQTMPVSLDDSEHAGTGEVHELLAGYYLQMLNEFESGAESKSGARKADSTPETLKKKRREALERGAVHALMAGLCAPDIPEYRADWLRRVTGLKALFMEKAVPDY